MFKGGRRQRSVGEDELILADLEGSSAARATVGFGRERRRRMAHERWGQLQRIAEVYGLGEQDAFDDVRLRVLHEVIGYVDEHVWRDTVDDVRRHILEDVEGNGWFPEVADRRRVHGHLEPPVLHDGSPAQDLHAHETALFQPVGYAISDMTMDEREAASRAAAHLVDEHSSMIVDETYVCPNPYLDLWLVGYTDPQQPGAQLDGGGAIVVLADGQTYRLDAGPGRPRELLGAILPPDDEWE